MKTPKPDVVKLLHGCLRSNLADDKVERLELLEQFLAASVESLDAHPFGGTAMAARARMAKLGHKLGIYEAKGWVGE